MHTDWFIIVFLKLERNAEVVQAVDIMMVQAKRIYILMIKVNKLVSFSLRNLIEIEIIFFMFPYGYRNTPGSLGELEKGVKTLACGSFSHSISHSPKLPLMFLHLDRNMVHVFYFLSDTRFLTC